MNLTNKTYTLKLRRIDICDLLIAATACAAASEAEKWVLLHDKILEQLDKQDKERLDECI